MGGFVKSCGVLGLVLSTSLGLAACSGGEGKGGSPSPSPMPSGTSTTPPPGATDMVVQTGTIVDFLEMTPIAGARITAGGVMTTSDSKGNYSLTLPKGQSFGMVIEADNHVKVVEQGTILTADFDRGKTFLVAMSDANLLKNILRNDGTLGLLSIAVLPTGNCKSVAGTTLDVTSSNENDKLVVKYFLQNQPSNVATSASDGAFPSAVVYNFTPGAKLTINVNSPSCAEAAYPVVTPQITYLGTVETEPSGDDTQGTTSFQRIFLQ
jgi:hypothetical protein